MKKTKIIGLSILLFGISTITTAQNQAPVLNTGSTIRQAYCPETEIIIAPDFTITNEDDLGVDSFSIQISSGYFSNSDLLELNLQDHPNIKKDWSSVEGKLKLTPKGGTQILYTDIQKAVRAVVFKSSSSNISGEKYFSFTIGSANYLPSTGHFYVFESDLDITWTDAKTKAEGKTYYGLKGYLATILSAQENQISAEQITGTGWIGASDTNQEGVWNWVTGPEAITNFWNGTFTGSAPIDTSTGLPMYSNWNTDEPNQSGDEDYAHITDNSIGLRGSWNDLPNEGGGGPYQAKGYIIEYGGMPGDPILQISASTSIYVPNITSFDPILRNCNVGTMTFTATVSEGKIYWYDAPIGGNLVETGGTFTTPSLNSSKIYYVAASPEGCATTPRIEVKAIIDITPVVVTPPSDINRCDEDRVGFLTFDLQTDETPNILAGLDPILNPDLTEFEVLYFNNLPDAQANTTATIIANPYRVNTTDNPTISARIHNINNATCYTTVEFKLKVTDTPAPSQPSVYRLCDDTTSSGGDTDGISSFVLNDLGIDAEILATVSNPSDYTISYHTDLADAKTSSTTNAIPKDIDYEVTVSQRVYVRIENIDNVICNVISDDTLGSIFTSFELIVDPLPVVNSSIEIDYCIVTGDPNPTVDLTQAEDDISSTTGARFEYFKDSSGLIPVLAPVSYPPVGNVYQSVYVKVLSNKGCPRNLVELKLNIGETPNNSFNDLVDIACDDFLDAGGIDTPGMNDDKDNITYFYLDETAIITAINNPSNTEVFFYESTADRNSNNSIPDITNYRNNPTNIDITIVAQGIRFPIYYKILSLINNDCEGIGQFYLELNKVPSNSSDTLPAIVACDNAIWDGDYTNGSNDRIDLRQIEGTSIGQVFEGTGQDVADFDFLYFSSKPAAFSGDTSSAEYIATPDQFTNSVPASFVIGDVVTQTIYLRIKNIATGCINPHTSFDIVINPAPITTTPILPVEVCDLGSQDGDTGNGYAQNIDISDTDFYVRDGRPAGDVIITYHKNIIDLADLTSDGVDKFNYDSDPTRVTIDPVTNISEEKLFIRIIDISSPSRCVFDQSTVTIIVYPEPTAIEPPNQSYCDDDSDGDDTNGFVQNINLDALILDILVLGPTQSISDFTVTFHEDPLDLPVGGNALTTPYTNTLPDRQTIYVRVENKDTGCVNDDITFEMIINPLPKFKVTSPQIVCLSGPPLTLFVENPAAVYDYVWTAPNGDEFPGVDEITIESGGLYTVTATTTNGTLCTRTREIQVNESIVATITDADVTIVDDSENNSITIDPTNLGIGDYQYALINEDGIQTTYQDIPLFENLAGGFYTIVVEDKNGCRPNATLEVSVIEYPKFFTPNNDGINDTWAIKGANSTFYPTAQINIFNRFGKVVAQIEVDTPGWTGTYGGKTLPSDDYWFSIVLVDRNGNARERKGNFSLLRR